MPCGKPAGVRCIQLDERLTCRVFGNVSRPQVCASLPPSPEMCGRTREEAMERLEELEVATKT